MKEKIAVGDILLVLILALLALIMVIPFWQIVVIALSSTRDYLTDPYHLILRTIDLHAFATIFSSKSVLRGLAISLFTVGGGTLTSLFLTVAGGYVLSHKSLPGRSFFLTLMVLTMYFNGGIISTYVVVRNLGLVDTLFALILPYCVNTFYLILVKNYVTSLAPELEEAAKIDGCNEIRILWQIILPVCKPILMTIGMFYIVNYWNDFFSPTMFLYKNELSPLSLILRNVVISRSTQVSAISGTGAAQATEQYTMALILISILPILFVYPWIQRYFTTGIMVGSVKG